MKSSLSNTSHLNDDDDDKRANIISYAHKRSILRKLMICQRKQFMLRKEQMDMNKLKKHLMKKVTFLCFSRA